MSLEIFDVLKDRNERCAIPLSNNNDDSTYFPETIQELYECQFAWYLVNYAIEKSIMNSGCSPQVTEYINLNDKYLIVIQEC